MTKARTDRQALQLWDEFMQAIRSTTTIDLNETEAQKQQRIKKLEGDHEAWFKYYFPHFCFSEPAQFHKGSSNQFLSASRIYHCRAWARGLSKSTRRMMEVFFKMFAQRVRLNTLLISKSQENAARLLAPYKANLEVNQRLIHDYGEQQLPGKWAEGEFTTRTRHTFRAVGKGQNPRGARNEELRINLIIFDDVDDDEECLNEDRLDKTWNWIQEAVIPTVDISEDYWICFDNNIIAANSIAKRAQAYATFVETINIRDEENKSTWPQKNSEEDIDYMLSILSEEAAQKEFFNNPMTAGKTFPEMKWGKCPALSTLPFVVIYADPSTSNNDKPTIRSNAQVSRKAVFVVGKSGPSYYVYTGFLDTVSNSLFTDWLFTANDHAAACPVRYTYIENNSLQDPFYKQVLLPLIFKKNQERNSNLAPIPDARDKPSKWLRIEGTLQPLNANGLLILNIDERENPHMKRLEAQFKAARATSKLLDGPDAIEGAVWIINQKTNTIEPGAVKTFPKQANAKRF